MRILFVCLGNICRSPIAQGVARKLADSRGLNIEVDSCGTGNWHIGEAPCQNSIKVARSYKVDISMLRARQIAKEDLKSFELIVALDQSNYDDLKRMGAENLVKLGDYGFGGKDIPDPYFFKAYDGFDRVYKMIESAIEQMLDSLKSSASM